MVGVVVGFGVEPRPQRFPVPTFASLFVVEAVLVGGAVVAGATGVGEGVGLVTCILGSGSVSVDAWPPPPNKFACCVSTVVGFVFVPTLMFRFTLGAGGGEATFGGGDTTASGGDGTTTGAERGACAASLSGVDSVGPFNSLIRSSAVLPLAGGMAMTEMESLRPSQNR